MKNNLQILLLDDTKEDAVLIGRALSRGGLSFNSTRVCTMDAFLEAMRREPPDVILADHGMPEIDGFTALQIARMERPEAPFLFVTGPMGEEVVIESLKDGAADYILKTRMGLLVPALRRALRCAEERRRSRTTPEAAERSLLQNRADSSILETALARHTAILNAMLDAMISIDNRGTVVDWNPAAELTFGYSAEEAIGRKLDDLIIPQRQQQLYHGGLVQYLITGAGSLIGRPIEMVARRSDEREISIEVGITPVPHVDPPLFTAIARDITARKQAEAEIYRLNTELEQHVRDRTAALEVANEELESFSYSVSHDLRAPLRHISGFVEVLEARSGGVLEREHDLIRKIGTSAEKMTRLIDSLLAFSQLGLAELRKIPLQLDKLVHSALEEVEAEDPDRSVQWVIRTLPAVDGDPDLLRQVLINLLSNAFKFTRGRERASIEVGARRDAGEVVCYVRDNGVGFDMRYADKLFGVFQRLHRESEFEGTGIGLANVRLIIRRHGGRVWGESIQGEGTTIFFALPLSKEVKG